MLNNIKSTNIGNSLQRIHQSMRNIFKNTNSTRSQQIDNKIEQLRNIIDDTNIYIQDYYNNQNYIIPEFFHEVPVYDYIDRIKDIAKTIYNLQANREIGINHMNNCLNNLVDCLTELDQAFILSINFDTKDKLPSISILDEASRQIEEEFQQNNTSINTSISDMFTTITGKVICKHLSQINPLKYEQMSMLNNSIALFNTQNKNLQNSIIYEIMSLLVNSNISPKLFPNLVNRLDHIIATRITSILWCKYIEDSKYISESIQYINNLKVLCDKSQSISNQENQLIRQTLDSFIRTGNDFIRMKRSLSIV